MLVGIPRERQGFILEWTRWAAATNTELAFQFANRARQALLEVEPEVISAWCLHAMDSYDRAGYTVLDDVAKLPTKVSDIYRKITS